MAPTRNKLTSVNYPVYRPFTQEHADDKQFLFEALLDKQVLWEKGKKRVQYLVRWRPGDYPEDQRISWSDRKDIDPDMVKMWEAENPKRARAAKKITVSGVRAFPDLEAGVAKYESDEESVSSEGDDFVDDEGEDVESSDEESDDEDDGSEYSPSDDDMEVDADSSDRQASDNDASESDLDDNIQVASRPPKKEASVKEESTDDSSSSDEDEEEDADGEELTQEEQDDLAKKSIFNKK